MTWMALGHCNSNKKQVSCYWSRIKYGKLSHIESEKLSWIINWEQRKNAKWQLWWSCLWNDAFTYGSVMHQRSSHHLWHWWIWQWCRNSRSCIFWVYVQAGFHVIGRRGGSGRVVLFWRIGKWDFCVT